MPNVQVVKPPKRQVLTRHNSVQLFLAGSIEMGSAEDWQTDVCDFLEEELNRDNNAIVYNPRRDDWDSSWSQDLNNPQFFEQVSWELDRIDNSDIVAIYLAPDTKSPISLLELGKVCHRPKDVIVCCPDGFWRKGNVDIVCYQAGIPVCPSLSVFKQQIIDKVNARS